MILLQRLLFALAAGFRLVTGALAQFGMLDLGAGVGTQVLGLLMLGNGVGLALTGWFTQRGHRLADFGALVLVATNALLNVTDENGLLDLLSLFVSGALLVLLIANLRAHSRRRRDP